MGERIPKNELDLGEAIIEDGEVVGVLIPLGVPFQGNQREHQFIERTNRILLFGEQAGDHVEDGRIQDLVKIVQNQHKPVSALCDLIDQDMDQRLERSRLDPFHKIQQIVIDAGNNVVKRGQQVLQKADWIVIAFF